MGQCVNTGSAGQTFWLGHHVVCIDDCHVWQQLIVSQRVFCAVAVIGDNCKWSYLGTGTRRGWDCNKVCFFAHLREGVNSLADIHEAHSQIQEVYFRMLVHYPHDLTCVHCRTAAQCDDAVWFECAHCMCAGFCAGEVRVRCYFIEAGVLDSHFVKFILNWFYIAIFIKEGVGDNEASLLAHYLAQFIQGNRHTAFLQVYFLRCSKPQHIFSPLGYGLDV